MHDARSDERLKERKEESIPELLRQLASETTTLVRQEIDLAKVELGETAKTAGVGAAYLAGAAVLGLGAFGALTTCLIAVLALVVPVWVAALIVCAVYGTVAFVLVRTGRQKLAAMAPVVPQQTTETVKEDVEWVKTRAQSGRR